MQDQKPSRSALACLAPVLIVLAACDPAEDAAAPAITAPPVMVVAVEIRDVSDRIDATGQLVAKAKATIASQVDGEATGILVEEGDSVEQGSILLEIDPQRRELELVDAEARLAEARAQLADSEREWKRMQRLSKSAAASQARLDEAQTGLSLARSRLGGANARLGLARRALEDATIRAPFSGLIARRHVSVGEYLSVGLPLFELVALDPIEVEFTLAEIDSARVKIGHPVEVRVAPYPDEQFMAHVSVISPTIDPGTRTLRVKAELPNLEGRLKPGLFMHANLGVSERSGVVMVPEDALVQRADGSVLFKLVEGPRVQRLGVQTGVFREGWVEVINGLRPGDRVVVRGQGELFEGSAVSVREHDGRPVDASSTPVAAGERAEPLAQRTSE
jgi:membrane fusion protein (multidrug efflux system)